MPRPTGGRGYKGAGTVHIRIPLPIEAEVRKLVNEFYEETDNDKLVKALPSFEEVLFTAQQILTQKKSARASLSKLLSEIYGQEVKL